MDISIIICTFNRSALLRHLLEDLERQIATMEKCRVLVINNNSTDGTSSVLAEFANRINLLEVEEKDQGLAVARNRGIRESAADVLIFVDDDMRLDVNWVAGFVEAFEKFPGHKFFGGRIRPYWPNGKPNWVRDENMPLLSGVFGCFDFGNTTRLYTSVDDGPVGGSFAVRRNLFEEIGVFNDHFGRKGSALGRGEETDFFFRARKSGEEGIYVGKSLCHHYVDPARLKLHSLWKYGIESGKAHQKIRNTEFKGNWRVAALGSIVKGVWQLVKGRGDNFRQCIINGGIAAGMTKL